MNKQIEVLDVVELTEQLADHKLRCGQVGTVVEKLAPDVFEVGFTDENGRALVSLPLKADQLTLYNEPIEAA